MAIGLVLLAGRANAFGPFDPALQPRRIALLDKAGAELRGGDALAALDDYEHAAMMYHAADAETGLILAALQSGQYRRALAFCAHTAGAHLEDTDAGALYAWLLRIGGQETYARQVLDRTLARFPEAPFVNAVAQAFPTRLPIATGRLLEPKDRLAPWPTMLGGQTPVSDDARPVGGAVLRGAGRQAVMPATTLIDTAATRLWVRNGLGQTTEAVIDRSDPAWAGSGLILLRLAVALPDSTGAVAAFDRPAPFAGSPGYAVQYAETAEPAWPWLRQGFLGGVRSARGGNASERGDAGGGSGDGGDSNHPIRPDLSRRLGFDVGNSGSGGGGAPVLDARGRLVGITLRAAGRDTPWLPVNAWPDRSADGPVVATSLPGGTDEVAPLRPADVKAAGLQNFVAPDLIYEGALKTALQVVAAPR